MCSSGNAGRPKVGRYPEMTVPDRTQSLKVIVPAEAMSTVIPGNLPPPMNKGVTSLTECLKGVDVENALISRFESLIGIEEVPGPLVWNGPKFANSMADVVLTRQLALVTFTTLLAGVGRKKILHTLTPEHSRPGAMLSKSVPMMPWV